MASKVLGQSNPAATTNTDLYTVPSAKAAVCSTISICNQDTVTISYRILVRVAGAAATAKQYLVKDATLPVGSSDFLTLGITLATTDVVTVYASTANVSFNLFGDES